MRDREVRWGPLLEEATERVRLIVSTVAQGGDRSRKLGVGASGDTTIVADKEAEEEILKSVLAVQGVRALSEEAGNRGDPASGTVAVIDPLDGSSNFEKGIPFYCTSVAIVEGEDVSKAVYGLVRNLVNGDVYQASKGRGATKNGKRIHTSEVSDPGASVVGIDLSRAGAELMGRIEPLVSGSKRQVHFGANALELCMFAEGKLDAFVDLRGKMRVTDFAAAYLIAREAGGTVTDGEGKEVRPGLDLEERFSYVASANQELHEKIIGLCRKKGFRS